MNTSLTPHAQIDIAEAFGFVFRSRNWFGRLAVGALCLLFFWLFFIPVFILLGYLLETARTISRGGRELPPWTDIGKKLSEGFILAVVLFIWNLPASILSSSGSGLHCVNSSCSYSPNVLAPLGGLYSLLLGLLTAAIWSQFLDGGFAAAFDFRAIFRRAGLNPGMTVIVWLMAIVAGIIGALGVILVGIGLLFTLPYAFAVNAHLYGQFRQLTHVTQSVANTPMGDIPPATTG
ncbi:MAG TPA: DUF4013 domain-containing protein [Ktedonobacterales bacterium]|nr:DUF4013 domain-containing protein [Ktedonobacterales bacterium]